MHDVALKQLIALREPPPDADGTVASVQVPVDPSQISTRLSPFEAPMAAQKLGPAHDTEENELSVGALFTGIVPVHEDPFHRSA